tara:strand:+ start:273 stop:407 length:135 start_codon:yes stop_codon:yes gene_type:complete
LAKSDIYNGVIKVACKVDTAVRVSDMAKLAPLIYAIRLDANPLG